MKLLRKIALTAKILSVVAVVLFTAMAVVIFYPNILVNKWSIDLGQKMLRKSGIIVTYDEMHIDLSSTSTLRKKFSFDALNLCLTYEQAFEGCFNEVNAHAALNITGRPVLVTEIGPLKVGPGKIKIFETTQAGPNSEETDYRAYLRMLRNTKVNEIRIQDIEVTYVEKTGKNSVATLSAESTISTKGAAEFNGKISGSGNFPIAAAEINFSGNFNEAWHLQDGLASITAQLRDQETLKVTSRVKREDAETIHGEVQMHYEQKQQNRQIYDVNVKGGISGGRFSGQVDSKLRNIVDGIDNLDFLNCAVTGEATDEFETINVSIQKCHASLKRRLIEGESDLPVALPVLLGLMVDTQLHMDLKSGIKFEGSKASIELDPIKNGLYQVNGKFNIDFEGSLAGSNPTAGEAHSPFSVVADAKVSIEKFESLVTHLEGSAFSIPAPLNSLSGKVECVVSGSINFRTSLIGIPHICSTDLAGKEQAFKINEEGVLRMGPSEGGFFVDYAADITLLDVELFLPGFKLTEPLPVVKSDSRFTKAEIPSTHEAKTKNDNAGAEKNKNVAYDITIKTTKKPVRIHVPSHEAIVPIHFDLKKTNDRPLTGSIRVARMEFKVINKIVDIDHVNFEFSPTKPPSIDAKARIPRSEYDVIVLVAGPLTKPRMQLTSDPLRPNAELVSGLMYGGGFNELDGGQQKSVSQTQAAMADGAIGLISMLYLASTPIESVGYNAATQQFSAQVKLSDKASFRVGSNMEGHNEVGLTKRLFGNWTFETFAYSEEEGASSRGVAMLKWAKRY